MKPHRKAQKWRLFHFSYTYSTTARMQLRFFYILSIESVVGESVVVIKKLLQLGAKEHTDIIVHMAKIIDKISIAMARASILWLIGEYSDHIPKIAPDVLRKMAKSFISEVSRFVYFFSSRFLDMFPPFFFMFFRSVICNTSSVLIYAGNVFILHIIFRKTSVIIWSGF